MSYGNSWLETILRVLISGRNNKSQSPGWLVSLVIGDYLAWFGEHLFVGLKIFFLLNVTPKC